MLSRTRSALALFRVRSLIGEGGKWLGPAPPIPALTRVEIPQKPPPSFSVLRVSVAELQTHPELDTDGDAVLSEEEAQVPQAYPWPRVNSG